MAHLDEGLPAGDAANGNSGWNMHLQEKRGSSEMVSGGMSEWSSTGMKLVCMAYSSNIARRSFSLGGIPSSETRLFDPPFSAGART